MEEQKLLKKQFFLHIFYNMIAFSIIFIVFGGFVFFMVKNIMFSSVDKQLIEAKKEFLNEMNDFEILHQIFVEKNFEYNEFSNGNAFFEYGISRKINNPQIIFILRDKNENILNEDEIGRVGQYKDDIIFSSQNLNTIYHLKLGNKYNYHVLNFALDSDDEYVQLLINVDSEIVLINSYLKIIIDAVIVGILLSCIASYILSKKTLKPVEQTLQRQIEFVQNASHELRTPLTIIQAKQELLLQEPNAKIIDKSEEIMLTLNETKRLSKLTKDLMVLVRGTNIKLQKDDVNLDEFIQNIVIPYRELIEAQEKKLILNLNFGKEVSIDTNKIHQLFVILIDNAIKYTETGDTIQINTNLKDNKCVIEICDTGIGISDDGLTRIFDRFYREDKARNRETGGSGLRTIYCCHDCKFS